MNCIDILLTALAVVFVVDLSGFILHLKRWICRWLGRSDQDFSLKPLDCSFCMTHHICLGAMLLTGTLTLPLYTFTLFVCFFTPVIKDLLNWLRDLCVWLVDKLYFF